MNGVKYWNRAGDLLITRTIDVYHLTLIKLKSFKLIIRRATTELKIRFLCSMGDRGEET